MTTLTTKSQALNVWGGGEEKENFRIDIVPHETLVGTYETRIAHKAANGEHRTIQFPGAVVFFSGGVRYVLAHRFLHAENSVIAEKNRALGEEKKNGDAIATEKTRAEAAESGILANLSQEVLRATTAEGTLTTAIATETAARIAAVGTVSSGLASELTARAAADTIHTSGIAANASAITANSNAITAEATRAGTAETGLQTELTAVATSVTNLQTGSSSALATAVSTINTSIAAEKKDAADATAAEKTRAEAAETALDNKINAMLSNTDPAALDSFTEVITDYQANGLTLTTSLNAALARILQLENTVAALQSTVV